MNIEQVIGPVAPDNVEVIPKGWGYERIIINSPLYCGKELVFFSGRSCSFHYHRIKDETFLITRGAIQIRWNLPLTDIERWWEDPDIIHDYDAFGGTYENILYQNSNSQTFYPGDVFHVPVGMIHQMKAFGDSALMEFSTHHKDSDSYRLIPGN